MVVQSQILDFFNSHLSGYRPLTISFAGLCSLFGYFLVIWLIVGRDPERGTVFPLFEPSENMSPAVLRYIWKKGYDGRCFGAAILSMVVKGYVTIHEQFTDSVLPGPSFVLERNEGVKLASLSSDERKLAKVFFPHGTGRIDLRSIADKRFWRPSRPLRKHLSWEYNRTLFHLNVLYWVPGFTILILFIIGVAVTGGILSIITTLVILWLYYWWRQTIRAWRQQSFFLAGISLLIALCSNIALLTLIIALIVIFSRSTSTVPLTSFIFTTLVLTVTLLASIRFYTILQAPTKLGQKILDRIEGFRNYLVNAEENQMRKLYPADELPKHYHPNLPFALALDIKSPWLMKFSAALPTALESEWIIMGPDEDS